MEVLNGSTPDSARSKMLRSRDRTPDAAGEAPAGPQYLYGIVARPGGPGLPTQERSDGVSGGPLELDLAGIDDRPVHLVSRGPVAAVTSDLRSRGPVRTLRRNLMPHHRVIAEVTRRTAILPMRFGTVAGSPAAVGRFLKQHCDKLVELLELVDGCSEIGLKVSWHSVNPAEQLVLRHPELARLRDELFGNGRKPGRDDSLELGRLFESSLRRERETHENSILGPLEGLCRRVAARPPASESVLVDAALLVPHPDRERLEERISEIASRFGPEYLFQLGGYCAPFSFTTIDPEE